MEFSNPASIIILVVAILNHLVYSSVRADFNLTESRNDNSSLVEDISADTPQPDSGVALCQLSNRLDAVYWRMAESQPPGSVIITLPIEGVSALGREDRNIELTLTRGMDSFQLNSDTKQLLLAKSVDRDSGTDKLTGAVRCKVLVATGDLVIKELEHSIFIIVQDANDNPPVFNKQDYYVNITEELPIGSVILSQLVATDADQAGRNSEIQYTVANEGIGYTYVGMSSPWKGEVVVRQRIDYETIRNFSVAIVAKDSGVPPLQSKAYVHINVVDMDDLNPVFEYQSYFTTLDFQAQPGPLKIQPAGIKAFDGDTLGAPISYTLSGERVDDFAIDMLNGDITYRGNGIPPSSYTLSIHAKQLDRPEREAQATLRVMSGAAGPNLNRPYFTRKLYTAEISESAPVGVKILQVTAMDYDKASTLFYSIKDSFKYPEFSLGRGRGELALARELDYEKKDQYHLTVLATDGKQTAEAAVQIFVLNANDHAPIFDRQRYLFRPTNRHGEIGRVQALDSDSGSNLRYRLANLNDLFAINPSDGRIFVSDVGRVANVSYELVVIAEDDGEPPRAAHANVVIDLADTIPPPTTNIPVVIGTSEETVAGSGFVGNSDGLIRMLAFGLGILALLLIIACILLLLFICRLRKRRAQNSKMKPSHFVDKLLYANYASHSTNGNVGYVGTVCDRECGTSSLEPINGIPSGSDSGGYYGVIDKRRPRPTTDYCNQAHSTGSGGSPHGSTSPLHRASPSTDRLPPPPPPMPVVATNASEHMVDRAPLSAYGSGRTQPPLPRYNSSVNDRRLSHTYVPVVESIAHRDFLLARAQPRASPVVGRQELREIRVDTRLSAGPSSAPVGNHHGGGHHHWEQRPVATVYF